MREIEMEISHTSGEQQRMLVAEYMELSRKRSASEWQYAAAKEQVTGIVIDADGHTIVRTRDLQYTREDAMLSAMTLEERFAYEHARWMAQTTDVQSEALTQQEERLYENSSTELATLSVKGNESVKKAQHEAAERERIKQEHAEINQKLEEKMGADGVKALDETLNKAQDVSEFRKATEEDVFNFKKTLLKDDIAASAQYWTDTRLATAAGLAKTQEEYERYFGQIAREADALRAHLAHALNPNQTGSPSLNQEIAAGLVGTQSIFGDTFKSLHSVFAGARTSLADALSIGGNMNLPSAPGSAGPGGGAPGFAGMTTNHVSAPVNINIASVNASNPADVRTFLNTVGIELSRRMSLAGVR
jgi:hypothetical protein